MLQKNRKVLVADDDEAIQICMEDISKQEGWQLIFARDGEECLEMWRQHKPSLVVLDQRMPKLTGEEVLARWESEGAEVPVILISAEKDLSRMSRFSMIVKVLNKPFELEDFISLVNHHLQELPEQGPGPACV